MPAADAGSALIAQQVDAAVTYELYIAAAQAQDPSVQVIYTAAADPGLISDVLAARAEFAQANSETMVALLQVWDQAVQFLADNPEDGRAIIARAVESEPAELATAFDGVEFFTLAENREGLADGSTMKVQEGTLWLDLWASVYRISVGWLVSTALALPIGILMGNFQIFEGLFEPFVDLVRYMPAVAFVPLTILWLGVGDTQKFAILFIGVFFQEVLLIMDNVKTVPRDLIQVSYTFGLSKWEVLRAVILPAAMPGIWDTFRITLGWAWTYLVVAELVAANVGLGYRIMRAQRFLETDQIILGILVIGILGLATDMLFKWSYRRLFPWMAKR